MTAQFIFIMGMKHSGKSTLGKLLSKELSIPFFDLDREIERIEGRAIRKKRVREIYRERGKEGFQKLEEEALESIFLNEEAPLIIAIGGGTIENEKAMARLREEGTRIYLKNDADTLWRRIVKGGIPAFLSGEDPYREFLELYKKRNALYETEDCIEVSLEGKSIEEALEAVKTIVRKYSNVG